MPSKRVDMAGLLWLLIPIAGLLVVPDPELGALAAKQKTATTSATSRVRQQQTSGTETSAPKSFEDAFITIASAAGSPDFAATAGVRDGVPVTLTGFVSKVSGNGTFELTRFYISCCAADATAYGVTVESDTEVTTDQWLTVRGKLADRGERFVLQAQQVADTEKPSNPYLSF